MLTRADGSSPQTSSLPYLMCSGSGRTGADVGAGMHDTRNIDSNIDVIALFYPIWLVRNFSPPSSGVNVMFPDDAGTRIVSPCFIVSLFPSLSVMTPLPSVQITIRKESRELISFETGLSMSYRLVVK